MSEEMDSVPVPVEAGECARCVHARALRNRRGSVFVLCRRSVDDDRFRRYPPLPVVGCAGFETA
jgi:hypothetical protein